MIVNKATPTIAWSTPAAITFGTPLSSAQLDATANVAGTFAYNPSFGVVLGAGQQLLTATFSPNDATDYNSATASVTLQVTSVATLQSIIVTPANSAVFVGSVTQFAATGNYSDGTTRDLTNQVIWTSSKSSVAAVGATGLATANTPGRTSILATVGNISGSTALTVIVPDLDIRAELDTLTIDGSGEVVASVKLKNTGNITALNVSTTVATLGGVQSSTLPAPISSLAPGASARVQIVFPSEPKRTREIVLLSVKGSASALLTGGKVVGNNWVLMQIVQLGGK
jgi:hypothetical protein